jgi:hypothetical protein
MSNIVAWGVMVMILNVVLSIFGGLAGTTSNTEITSDLGESFKDEIEDTLTSNTNDNAESLQSIQSEIAITEDRTKINDDGSEDSNQLLDLLDSFFAYQKYLSIIIGILGMVFLSLTGLTSLLTALGIGNVFLLLLTIPLHAFSLYLIVRLILGANRTG